MRYLILNRSSTFSQQTEKETLVLKENNPYIVADFLVRQLEDEQKKSNVDIIRKNKDIYQEFFKYNGNNLDNRNLIILRTGGFGDIIFLTPMVKQLRKLYPTCKIFLACGQRFSQLFVGLDSCFNAVYKMPLDLLEIKDYLGYNISKNNTYIISFEGMVENSQDAKIKNIYDLHREAFGLEEFDYEPEIKIHNDIIQFVKERYFNDEEKLDIAFQMSATSPIRSWKPEYIIEFFNRWKIPNTRFFIMESPFKYRYAQKILETINNPILNESSFILQPPDVSNSLHRAVAMVSFCKLVIAPDSSMLHIAACLNRPMVGLYGAFPSGLRMKYYKNAIGIDAMSECFYGNEEFRSCYDHGHFCKLAQSVNRVFSPCMDLITPEIVLKVVYNFLGKLNK